MKLTVTVITHNESRNIAAALESVAWADEIVVVDSGSTDDTVEIAKRLATRVEVRDWPGYGAQKNHAASLASNDWILSLDADERVTPALAQEIRGVLNGVRRSRLSDSANCLLPGTMDPGDGLVSGLSAATLRSARRDAGTSDACTSPLP